MPIKTVSYDRIISSNDWEETGSGNEKILTAKPKNLGVSFFQYDDGENDSPVLKFKANSKIRISGGELIYDTDDIEQ